MRRVIAWIHDTAPATRPGRKNRRRSAERRRRLYRHALGLGLSVLALATVAGSAAWAWESGWISRRAEAAVAYFHERTAELGLAVTDVLVEGRERTSREALLSALGVSRGSPILALSPLAAKRRIEALPWIKSAAIERRLPDGVYVRIVERRPMALWQLEGKLSVIDQDGQPIPGAAPGRFAKLPLVVGEDAPRHAARLLAVLRAEPALAPRVQAAVRVGGRRWNVRLDNGVDVQLPEEGMAGAWNQLARIESNHRLLERQVKVIDLRLPDRLVVQMAPDGERSETDRTPGENT